MAPALSYTTVRERRRYRPNMPRAAWKHGVAPKLRRTRKAAMRDLSEGLERYLAGDPALDAAAWAAWALRIGAGIETYSEQDAPDGTAWSVTTVVDYP